MPAAGVRRMASETDETPRMGWVTPGLSAPGSARGLRPRTSEFPRVKGVLLRHATSRLRESAAISLREWSESRRRVCQVEAWPAATQRVEPDYDEIDVLGGNGRWRQKKAVEEKERRMAQEQLQAERNRQRERERRRKQAELEQLWRRQQEEEERRRADDEARRRREQEEQANHRRERELEEVRRRQQHEKEEMQRTVPLPCDVCCGSGQCRECEGQGRHLGVYLVGKLKTGGTPLDFGQKWQGCTACGGHNPGVLGDMAKGSGMCIACNGRGVVVLQGGH